MSDTAITTESESTGVRLRVCGYCPKDAPKQPMAHIREHAKQATAEGTNTATDRGRRRAASPQARSKKVSARAVCPHCLTKGVHKTVGDMMDCANRHDRKQFATWMTEHVAVEWEKFLATPEAERVPFMVRTMLKIEGEDRLSRPLPVVDFDASKRMVTLSVGTDVTRTIPIRNIRLIEDEATPEPQPEPSDSLPPVPDQTPPEGTLEREAHDQVVETQAEVDGADSTLALAENGQEFGSSTDETEPVSDNEPGNDPPSEG